MTAWRRLCLLVAARLPRAGDDRGSLAMAMMAVLVGATLGALILPMVISQNKATRFDMTRVRSLHAAQTGIDVMLGQIRDSLSVDGNPNVVGDPSRLPCPTKTEPFEGSANGTVNGVELQDRAGYSVYVAYWATKPTADGSPMSCIAGYGTYDPRTKMATPRYVVITSTGTDGRVREDGRDDRVDSGSRGRQVVSTYVVQTDDTNFAGGVIQIRPDATGTPYCMEAGSPGARDGTVQVFLEYCDTATPPRAEQSFAYRRDQSIQLTSSVSKEAPAGLCLNTSPAEHGVAKEVIVVLTGCGVANPTKCADMNDCPTPSNQQWAVDDAGGPYHRLRGVLPDKSDVDGFCIGVTGQGRFPVGLFPCDRLSDEMGTWAVPTRATGPGMAGAANKQLVNYRKPGMCLTVTDNNPDSSFLVLSPCQQGPSTKPMAQNQTFAPDPVLSAEPTKTLLKTTIPDRPLGVDLVPVVGALLDRPPRGDLAANSTTYCLTSPLSKGGYPRLTAPCPNGVDGANPSYVWTMSQTKDAGLGDLPYAQKFTVVDGTGQCLSPRLVSARSEAFMRAVVGPCDGSAAQKWNAPANLDTPRVTNIFESPPTP